MVANKQKQLFRRVFAIASSVMLVLQLTWRGCLGGACRGDRFYAGDVTDVAALAGTLVPSLAQKEESEPEPAPQLAGEKTEEEKPEVGPDNESQPASEKMTEAQPGAPPAGEAKPADELDADKADAAAGQEKNADANGSES